MNLKNIATTKLKPVTTEFVLCTIFAIIITVAVSFIIVILPFFRALEAWEIIRAVLLTIVGVWTHKKLFFKDYSPAKNSEMPIFTFYKYYMVIFSIYLLPTILLFINRDYGSYGSPSWPITLLHMLYLPQSGLMQMGMAIVDNTVVGYLATVAFYAVFLFLTISLRRRKESKAGTKTKQ